MLPQFESIPRPVGLRVIVLPDERATKTSSGLALASKTGNPRGTILSVGVPLDKNADLSSLKAGDRVEFRDVAVDLKAKDKKGKDIGVKVVEAAHIIAIL